MGRKSEPYKVIGIRPCGVITDEMLATKEWKEHWFNENVRMAKALGGKPKQGTKDLNTVGSV